MAEGADPDLGSEVDAGKGVEGRGRGLAAERGVLEAGDVRVGADEVTVAARGMTHLLDSTLVRGLTFHVMRTPSTPLGSGLAISNILNHSPAAALTPFNNNEP
ncbi:hypothetical protein LR48_Vigan04g126600 [Vigna angularis]|uniref:Uncharacterized protein n=1 Tax=Phaseolus angularis TaxID=3914 RepID=A0A0L9UEA8_PHAAN|nr:hypothetical protein LR48_Vigan04g126600 [Vigna angularis]